MYSTCIFCNRALGANTLIEAFPVGRRLAFDGAHGRLWVICRSCERWNLSPLEERWEAIEECERLFRATRTRASSENIGLARHAEGLELVRIGNPLRPEFAAWRYGDQFGRRKRRARLHIAGTGLLGAGTIASVATGAATGLIAPGLGLIALGTSLNTIGVLGVAWQHGRTRLRLRIDDDFCVPLRISELWATRFVNGGEIADWIVSVKARVFTYDFRGGDAARVVSQIMPGLNRAGARASVVQRTVREMDHAGGPQPFLRNTTLPAPLGTLGRMPVVHRLGIEMALHEEQERRALEGELASLELAWRQAEEVAAIADELLVPEGTAARIERLRDTG